MPGNGVAGEYSAAASADRGQAEPRAGGGRAAAGEGQQRAEAELPRARRRDEVRGGRLGRGQVDRPGEAGRGAGAHRERQPGAAPARRQRRDEQQHRPHEVELLLGRERPEVAHRRRPVLGREVVDGRRREVPVLPVERARADLGDVLRPVGGGDERERGRERAAEHEQRRRQDPPRAPHPEGAEPHAAVTVDLAQQVRGDQVARDREEHVDADEAAGQRAGPEVVDDDEGDRDGAQSLDLGAQWPPVGHAPTVATRDARAHAPSGGTGPTRGGGESTPLVARRAVTLTGT